jgi:hypothetical protein
MNAPDGLLGANEGVRNLIAGHVNSSDILIPGADVQHIVFALINCI